jgi:hypothetical protein
MSLMPSATETPPPHRGPEHRRSLRWIGAVAFGMSPWVTLGFATPFAFALAAIALRRLGRWHVVILSVSAAVYAVALGAGLATVDSASGTFGSMIFGLSIVITMVLGGVQAIGYAAAALARHRPGRRRPTEDLRTELHKLRHPRLAAWAVVAVATGLAVGGANLIRLGHDFAIHQRSTDGVVLTVGEGTSGCNGCSVSYRTTVRYQPPGRAPMTFWFGASDRRTQGSHLRVHYDPRHPQDARIDPGTDQEFGGFFLISLALVCGLGLAYAVTRYRAVPRSSTTQEPAPASS